MWFAFLPKNNKIKMTQKKRVPLFSLTSSESQKTELQYQYVKMYKSKQKLRILLFLASIQILPKQALPPNRNATFLYLKVLIVV